MLSTLMFLGHLIILLTCYVLVCTIVEIVVWGKSYLTTLRITTTMLPCGYRTQIIVDVATTRMNMAYMDNMSYKLTSMGIHSTRSSVWHTSTVITHDDNMKETRHM